MLGGSQSIRSRLLGILGVVVLGSRTPTALVQVATFDLGPLNGVTAADVTPAGDVVALRTYFSAVLFTRPAVSPLAHAFAQPALHRFVTP